MDGLDWIGAIVAALAGGGSVLHVAMKKSFAGGDDGTDGRGV